MKNLQKIYLSIYPWLYSPFVGPWPLFQFLIPVNSRQGSSDGGSALRKEIKQIEDLMAAALNEGHVSVETNIKCSQENAKVLCLCCAKVKKKICKRQ